MGAVGLGDGVVLERFELLPGIGLQTGRIGERALPVAVEDQGLDLLGPQHRPHAGTAAHPPAVVLDHGEAHPIFAGRPDGQDARGFGRDPFAQHGFGFEGVQAPQVVGRMEKDALIGDFNPHGSIGRPGDVEGIAAGPAHGDGRTAAGVGFAVETGQRRLGEKAVAAGAVDGAVRRRP